MQYFVPVFTLSKRLAFLVFFIWSNLLYAQQDTLIYTFTDTTNANPAISYNLTGIIKGPDNEPISKVSIYIDGQFSGTNTDDFGRYFLALAPGKYKVVIHHISMQPKTLTLFLYGNGVINITMSEKRYNLDEVIISAENLSENINRTLAGRVYMDVNELKTIPAFLGEPDIIKSLQFIPGVTSTGEGSSGFNVRGGQADQNLILINDALVLSSNHALGFLSPFNPDVTQDFTLYKGNVPSYYGGRTSSTLSISMRHGSLEKANLHASLGTATSKLLMEGPVIKNKVSGILAIRKSNSNWLIRKVKNPDIKNSTLNFSDLYGSIYAQLSPTTQVEVNTLYTGDLFKFSSEFGYEWNTSLSSLTIKSLLSKKISLIGMVAYGNFENSLFDPSGAESAKVKNGTSYWQGKLSTLLTSKKNSLTLGLEFVDYRSKPETIAPYNENSGITRKSVRKDRGIETAGFISNEWSPSDFFSVVAGIRFSYYEQRGPTTIFLYQDASPKSESTIIDSLKYSSGRVEAFNGFEPRISLRLKLSEKKSIKLSYTRLIQYIHSISNTSAPTPIDLWQVSTKYIPPQLADNFSAGLFCNSKQDLWSFSTEFFYRSTTGQIEYKDFAQLFLNKHIESELISSIGKAYGIEFQVKKNIGKWTGWLAYTYSRSILRTKSKFEEELINDGNWYPSNYDRPHIASIVLNRKLWPKGLFSISTQYSTGRPVGSISSSYIVNGTTIPNYSERNEIRLQNYFRVDLSITTGSLFKKIDDKLNISIYNLSGRRNAYSLLFKQDANSSTLKPYRVSILGTIFPSITYSFTVN